MRLWRGFAEEEISEIDKRNTEEQQMEMESKKTSA